MPVCARTWNTPLPIHDGGGIRSEVRGIAYSKCGRKLALAIDKKVNVGDAETGFVEWTLRRHIQDNEECTCQHMHPEYGYPVYKADSQCSLTGHSGAVWSVAFSKDGTSLVSGSADSTVKIWSVGSAGTFECEST